MIIIIPTFCDFYVTMVIDQSPLNYLDSTHLVPETVMMISTPPDKVIAD